MCGVGDFVLRGSFVRHRLTVDAWHLLSAKQRRKAVAACFKLGQSVSTASVGGITVPNTSAQANSGRKDVIQSCLKLDK